MKTYAWWTFITSRQIIDGDSLSLKFPRALPVSAEMYA